MSTTIEYHHIQCDKNWAYNHQGDAGRGITTWNINNQYTIPPLAPGGSTTLTFTCTVPKCYSSDGAGTTGKDVCLTVFNAWATNNTNQNNQRCKPNNRLHVK